MKRSRGWGIPCRRCSGSATLTATRCWSFSKAERLGLGPGARYARLVTRVDQGGDGERAEPVRFERADDARTGEELRRGPRPVQGLSARGGAAGRRLAARGGHLQ